MENNIAKKEEKPKEIKISKRVFIGSIVFLTIAVFAFILIVAQRDSQEDVVAIVNGEIITLSELEKSFDSLPQQYQGTVTKADLLNQIVQTKVFYQEAEKKGLLVSNEEARQQFQIAKLSSGLTEEQFSASLVAQGITEEELISQYGKQITVQKFIDENLLKKIKIKDEEVESYYSNNPDKFKVGESVTIKHILIGDENLTAEEKDKKAIKLLPKITKNNFCDFVEDYSTDTASISSCGEYIFTQADPLVEEFKQFSFNQQAGKIGTVKTEFGTHIIWTVKKIPPRTLPLDEVREQIRNFLKTENGKQQYNSFYEEISKGSKIEIKFNEL